ncbi:MAG: flavodoxin-dependent (E)-4-hydroxy-3-methylbut-2-enyl-diphosphate synthase, partial [Bacteroidales bacterium]
MEKIKVFVGNVAIGGGSPVVIQSMCNSSTASVESSFEQAYALSKEGARLIRLTTPTLADLTHFGEIKERLHKSGVTTPLVADVHFSYRVAQKGALIADKVRINPGNFAKDREVAQREFKKLIEICKERGCAIRIGVNHGSLGNYYTTKYGDTPYGMAMVAWEWLSMAKESNFNQIVLSLKSSNIIVMLEAYRLIYSMMGKEGTLYPLHLGVTEAGNDLEGRIKSALAISALLREGIGDTIRVSLTENPLNEISVAREIIDYSRVEKGGVREKKSPTLYNCSSFEQFVVRATCDYGEALLKREIDDIAIKGYI